MLIIRIKDLLNDVWLNLAQVTHVLPGELSTSGGMEPCLYVHTVGGNFILKGWTVEQWEAMFQKLQRQMTLMMGKGGMA